MGEGRKNWKKILLPDKGTIVLLIVLFSALMFMSFYPTPQEGYWSASTQESEFGDSQTTLSPMWFAVPENFGWLEVVVEPPTIVIG